VRLSYKNLALTEVKAGANGEFMGKASVYGVVDSYGDIVMPGAFTKSIQKKGNRIKVLAQHDAADVIGMATLSDSPDSLLASGKLVLELQSAKDMYTRLQNDLIDGISIGYVTDKASYDKNGLRQIEEIDLWEISLVTFPANDYARVTDVKAALEDREVEFIQWAVAEIKAGRALSAANEAHIRSAYDSHLKTGESLKNLIDALDAEKAAAKLQSDEAETFALALAASEALGKLTQ
jgi:hypothetical protein